MSKPHALGIIRHVCDHFDMQPSQLLGKDRHKNLVLARFIAMYLVRELLHLSYPQIGAIFHRDHTTAINGVKRALDMPRGSVHVKAILDAMVAAAEPKEKVA